MLDETKNMAVIPDWFTQTIAHKPKACYFQRDGVQLHYLNWSAQDAEHKPVLIFLHGFRGHARWWGHIAPFFTKDYRVFALDWSGMGESGHRDEYSQQTYVDDLHGLIQHLDASSVKAVAHSFGGGSTFRTCAQYPELFEHIVAIDSFMAFTNEDIGTDPVAVNKERRYSSLEEGAARFRLSPPQPLVQDYVSNYIAQHSLRQRPDGDWTWLFDSALAITDSLCTDADKILASLCCRVDYIFGEKSQIIDQERAENIYAALAKPGKLVCVPNGYHHLLLDHPEATISLLQALL